MVKFAILIAIVAAAVAEPIPFLNPLSPNGRIVGGEPITIEEAPHQVSIQVLGRHMCGGSRISDTRILTAAHCTGYPMQIYGVRSGSTSPNTGGTISRILSIKTHPNYGTTDQGIPINDISLLELNTALPTGPSQAPIGLCSPEETAACTKAIITGWGATKQGGSGTTVLHRADVDIVDKTECNKSYASFGGLPAGQMCAASPGKDACQGDSGGPLTCGGCLGGITSWGNGCAKPGYPGVYTEIPFHLDWIATVIGI